jgi:hypothetical protein
VPMLCLSDSTPSPTPHSSRVRLKQYIIDEFALMYKASQAFKRVILFKGTCSFEDKWLLQQAGKRLAVVGAVGMVLGATWYVTCVQLKKGDISKVLAENGMPQELSEQEKQEVITQFNNAVTRSRAAKLKSLFEEYTISQDAVKELLEVAVSFADTKTMMMLLQKIEDTDFTDKNGNSLLKIVITRRSGLAFADSIQEANFICTRLIEKGAKVNTRYGPEQWTPLMHAAFYDLPHLARILLNGKADRTLKDAQGRTAYDLGVENKASQDTLSLLSYTSLS